MLLRAILCGVVWNGFLLGQAKKDDVPCQFIVFFWHGWLPGLSCGDERSSWAASFGQLASWELERCQGACDAVNSSFWIPPDFWDADDQALEMVGAPNIWADGSKEDYPVGGFEVVGKEMLNEGEEIRSRKRKVIRVESEETQDYVREETSTEFEEEEERTFMPSAVSVPLKPLFRCDKQRSEKNPQLLAAGVGGA